MPLLASFKRQMRYFQLDGAAVNGNRTSAAEARTVMKGEKEKKLGAGEWKCASDGEKEGEKMTKEWKIRLLCISITYDACVYSRFSHILYIPDHSKTSKIFSRYFILLGRSRTLSSKDLGQIKPRLSSWVIHLWFCKWKVLFYDSKTDLLTIPVCIFYVDIQSLLQTTTSFLAATILTVFNGTTYRII